MSQQLSNSVSFYRPTWAEVSADAFASNLKQIRNIVGPSVKILAVLKADAYGHGANILSRVALENGAYGIGVSSLEEGIALRENGISAPILLLGGIYPLDNFSVAMDFDLIPTVASLEAAHALDAISAKKGKKTAFHLKVDTGMGRIGISPAAAKTLLEWVAQASHISLQGIYSHLACAEEDAAFSDEQLKLFRGVIDTAKKIGFTNVIAHIANSAATVSNIASHFDMIRPGLALYGVSPTTLPSHVKIQPVLNWKTKLVFLKKVGMNTPISYGRTFITKRDSDIATLPVGYADGVPRLVSNRGHVLIREKKCPIVGRVTMDHTMVDVTGIGATVGDEVVLIGSQGASTLDAQEWAKWAETNSYEILCGISKRVPRIYRGAYADR